MDITYLGHSAFVLANKSAKIVLDPFDPAKVGIKLPKLEADIVTLSHGHADHNNHSIVSGNPLVLDLPGEYEKNGVRIYGLETFHDKAQGADRGKNIMFKFEMDGISILHCGDLGHTLTSELIDEMGDIDVVLVPTGGVYTIDADEARHVIEKLEPRLVIPMHYRDASVQNNIERYGEMSTVEDFLSKIGVTEPERVKKLTLKASDLGEEVNRRVVVMEY